MSRQALCALLSMFLISLFLVSCGQFSPPESCGAGGTVHEETFNQTFAEMLLYDETRGGSPLIDTEAGPTFFPDRPVSIQIESLSSARVRFCVEERRGGGEISFDEIRTVSEGDSIISLGVFDSGSYVIRVIIEDVLIRNLPFVVEKVS